MTYVRSVERALGVLATLWVVALLAGCPSSSFSLTVRAQSGLQAGHEVRHVEARLFRGAVSCRAGGTPLSQSGRTLVPDDQRALLTGALTLASFEGLEPGVYTVRALFRRPPVDPRAAPEDGEVLVSRCVVVSLASDRVVRVVLTSDCLAVSCPVPGGSPEFDQCLNGRCVDPRCDPDEPSTLGFCCDRTLLGAACDTDPTLCGAASDCEARVACTAAPRCEEGVCVEPESDSCADGEYCERSTGTCREEGLLPPPVDAGALDAGMLDVGALDTGSDDAGRDAAPSPDATVPIAPPLAVTATEVVGTVDVVSLALMPTGERIVTGRMPVGRSSLAGIDFDRARPGGFVNVLGTARLFSFDMASPEDLDGGPRAALAGARLILTGATTPAGSALCGAGDPASIEAYVAWHDTLAMTPGCRWSRPSAGPGSESVGRAAPLPPSGMSAPTLVVPVRATGVAFGRSLAGGAVVELVSDTGAIGRVWELPFPPTALAVSGSDLLVVVGGGGVVWGIDLGLPDTAPPRWTASFAHPMAERTDLLGVAIGSSTIYAVGFVSSDVSIPGLAGAYDGWVVAADLAGTVRWSQAIGGARDDSMTRVAVARGMVSRWRLLVGGSVASDTTVGVRSEPAVRFSTNAEALLVELATDTGDVLGALRTEDGYVAELVERPDGAFLAATQHVVRTLE